MELQDPYAVHAGRLAAWTELRGASILDVGCGNGLFMRELEKRGAAAHGIEVDDAPLAAARAAGLSADRLKVGVAQSLPHGDGSFDGLSFVFSFHHVPAAHRLQALAEAARVLRPDGFVFVAEPLPLGPMMEVFQPIEDELEVRTQSQALLAGGDLPALRRSDTAHYEIARVFADVAAVIARAVAVDPERAEAAADPRVRSEVAARFARLAEPQGDRFILRQPCVAFLLRAAL